MSVSLCLLCFCFYNTKAKSFHDTFAFDISRINLGAFNTQTYILEHIYIRLKFP